MKCLLSWGFSGFTELKPFTGLAASNSRNPPLPPVVCLLLAVCVSNYFSVLANAASTHQSTGVLAGSHKSKPDIRWRPAKGFVQKQFYCYLYSLVLLIFSDTVRHAVCSGVSGAPPDTPLHTVFHLCRLKDFPMLCVFVFVLQCTPQTLMFKDSTEM